MCNKNFFNKIIFSQISRAALFVYWSACATSEQKALGVDATKTVIAHVFIHGTRLPGFALLSPQAIINQAISDDCRYVQILKKIRSDQRFFDRQIIMDMGLIPVEQALIEKCRQQTLGENVACKGAIQAITAYDEFAEKTNTTNLYYTYGWVGVLDDRYRQNDAKDLYVRLAGLMQMLRAQYPGSTVKLILHGHSHGGNLILYLARHEHEQKRNLVIDYAYLYGAPIQQETAHYCTDPIFKNIAIFYSHADLIQISDKFSVKSRTSCRTFSELTKLKKCPNNIQEICVTANGNDRAFGHASFFYFGEYANRLKRSGGKYRVFRQLDPCPLVILAPIATQLLDTAHQQKPRRRALVLNVKTEKNSFTLELAFKNHKKKIASVNLKDKLDTINQRVKKTWHPRGGSNMSSRAKQLTTCLLQPLEHVINMAQPTTIETNRP